MKIHLATESDGATKIVIIKPDDRTFEIYKLYDIEQALDSYAHDVLNRQLKNEEPFDCWCMATYSYQPYEPQELEHPEINESILVDSLLPIEELIKDTEFVKTKDMWSQYLHNEPYWFEIDIK